MPLCNDNDNCIGTIMQYCIAGKFGGELNLVFYSTTGKLKSAKICYSHTYVSQSRTELPNLNPPIFLQ